MFKRVVDALKFHSEYDSSKQYRDDEFFSDEIKKTKSGDCSMQSLIQMITKNYHSGSSAEIDRDPVPRLIFIQFIVQVWRLVTDSNNLWNYDYHDKGLDRNDLVWQRLFASSNNDDFNIEHVWTLFAGDKKNTDQFLKGIVKFDDKHVNGWIEGRSFQTLIGIVKGKIHKLNRTPVFKNGLHIDIVQEIHSFVLSSLVTDEPSPSEQQQLKKFHSEKAKEDILSNCISLKYDILFCMKNFSTYIMCCIFEQDLEDGTIRDMCNVVGVAIVKKL